MAPLSTLYYSLHRQHFSEFGRRSNLAGAGTARARPKERPPQRRVAHLSIGPSLGTVRLRRWHSTHDIGCAALSSSRRSLPGEVGRVQGMGGMPHSARAQLDCCSTLLGFACTRDSTAQRSSSLRTWTCKPATAVLCSKVRGSMTTPTRDLGFLPVPSRLRHDPAKPIHFGLALNVAFGLSSTFVGPSPSLCSGWRHALTITSCQSLLLSTTSEYTPRILPRYMC
jgi:hypothetical protein